MVYMVHLSVLIILLGALIGSCLGFRGYMNLIEGQMSNEVTLTEGEGIIELPFDLRCDGFEVSFYDTGSPKEFKSDLSILENGKEVLQRAVIVNDPLTYKGVTFYQASYGITLKEAGIELTEAATGKMVSLTLPYRKPVKIPDTDHRLMITNYQDNLMRLGAAIELVYGKDGQWLSSRWILVNRAYHGNNIDDYQVRITRTDTARFTGIDIKKDPGIWLVWTGFSILIISIGLTFYSSHKKIWICMETDNTKGETLVALAGKASRNSQVFAEEFETLCSTIERQLANPDTHQ